MRRKGFSILLVALLISNLLFGCQNSKSAEAQAPAVSKAVTQSTASTVQSKEPDSKAEIIMIGDMLLHDNLSACGRKADGSYNYDHFFKNVKDITKGADLALVNQEVIIGGRELGLSGYPNFNTSYEVADALANAGFDVVCHATNHALDMGAKGITNCLNYWKNNFPEVKTVGINASKDEQNKICVVEKNGIKIAVLNYTYGTNGHTLPAGMPYAVNYINKDTIAKDVSKAKALADFVIVAPHWGVEYTHTENKEQKELAKYMANLGVDLIIGTHPHVIQPIEWVTGDDGNKTLVYYSIGNYINCSNEEGSEIADRFVGGIADVTISKNSKGQVEITDYSAIPVISHCEGIGEENTVYLLSQYSEEKARKSFINRQTSNFNKKYLENVAKKVWGEKIKNY